MLDVLPNICTFLLHQNRGLTFTGGWIHTWRSASSKNDRVFPLCFPIGWCRFNKTQYVENVQRSRDGNVWMRLVNTVSGKKLSDWEIPPNSLQWRSGRGHLLFIVTFSRGLKKSQSTTVFTDWHLDADVKAHTVNGKSKRTNVQHSRPVTVAC